MNKNSSRGQWIAVGMIMTLLVGALGIGMLLTEDIAQVTTGAEAPDFTAVNLATGETVKLADYRGDIVLLNLWATWCGA